MARLAWGVLLVAWLWLVLLRLPVVLVVLQVASGWGNSFMRRPNHDSVLELMVGIRFHAGPFRYWS
ncbi:hypothetical protein PSEUDO8Z_170171 [Pseudomonas sp. 8Z]|nr:hypothetical protein PSEUDO8Z_170171 [Pseudomonas sp. 8Z]